MLDTSQAGDDPKVAAGVSCREAWGAKEGKNTTYRNLFEVSSDQVHRKH